MYRSLSVVAVIAVFLLSAGNVGHLGNAASPPRLPLAGAPPLWEHPAQSFGGDPSVHAQPFPFAQRPELPVGVAPSVTPGLTIIYPDGTISNHSAPITVSGNVYSITANFTGGLEIERNHTFVHGNNWTITTGLVVQDGVTVLDASGVTVRDLWVADGVDGFLVSNANFVHLISDHANLTGGEDIGVEDSFNVTISG